MNWGGGGIRKDFFVNYLNLHARHQVKLYVLITSEKRTCNIYPTIYYSSKCRLPRKKT